MSNNSILTDPSADAFHSFDPAVESWNESWFFSWLPEDGVCAATFRLGTLPNQNRAWLWLWFWTGDEWITFEETRICLEDLKRGQGFSYDKWGLRFSYEVAEPLKSGRLMVSGIGRVRNGKRSGSLVPISVDLLFAAQSPAFATGHPDYEDMKQSYPTSRFEQSVRGRGEVTFDDQTVALDCPGHRDRSWGPRTWEYGFMLGDIQGDDFQLYWGAGPEGEGGQVKGYVRTPDGLSHLKSIDAQMDYRDEDATLGASTLNFVDEQGRGWDFEIQPTAPSVHFDIHHNVVPPRHFLYWRTLIKATSQSTGSSYVGWFEGNRFPYSNTARPNT